MSTSFTVRAASTDDRDGILTIVRDAFSDRDRDGSEEVDVVVTTWALEAAPSGFELVAVDDGAVVAHVMAARGDLGGREVLGVAPLSVAPARHGEGVGTAVMTELVRRAEAANLPLLVLLGSPDYYQRFGFEASGPLGITYRPVGPDNPHFQARRLAAYDPSYRGDFTYCWEHQQP